MTRQIARPHDASASSAGPSRRTTLGLPVISALRVSLHDLELTEELARSVMGWRSAPGRFLKPGGSWLPKWRFAPLERLEDAFRLLHAAPRFLPHLRKQEAPNLHCRGEDRFTNVQSLGDGYSESSFLGTRPRHPRADKHPIRHESGGYIPVDLDAVRPPGISWTSPVPWAKPRVFPGASKARTITLALADVLGLDSPDEMRPQPPISTRDPGRRSRRRNNGA